MIRRIEDWATPRRAAAIALAGVAPLYAFEFLLDTIVVLQVGGFVIALTALAVLALGNRERCDECDELLYGDWCHECAEYQGCSVDHGELIDSGKKCCPNCGEITQFLEWQVAAELSAKRAGESEAELQERFKDINSLLYGQPKGEDYGDIDIGPVMEAYEVAVEANRRENRSYWP